MSLRAVLMVGALLGVSVVSLAKLELPVGVAASQVPAVPGDTADVRLAVSGMSCPSCATTARIALERAPGVYDAQVSYDSASAVVRYDPEATSPERFIAYLERMTGYTARVVETVQRPKEKA